jgi:hypothetical protein
MDTDVKRGFIQPEHFFFSFAFSIFMRLILTCKPPILPLTHLDVSTHTRTHAQRYNRYGDLIELTIVVRDNATNPSNRSETRLVFWIVNQDINDNVPVYASGVISAPFYEGITTAGAYVATVVATDADSAIGSFNVVRYIIEGESNLPFEINATTGVVTLKPNSTVDRETTAVYNITIRTEDVGVHSATPQFNVVYLVVNIEDKNDFAPFCNGVTVAHLSVYENQAINVPLLNFTGSSDSPFACFDVDFGNNATLNVTITRGQVDNRFAIGGGGNASGSSSSPFSLQLAAPLDFEEVREDFSLTVRVCDEGTPTPLCADLIVLIDVLDVNDNAPRCANRTDGYVVSLNETRPPSDDVFFTVVCPDADKTTANNVTSYSIVGQGQSTNGSTAVPFRVDSVTGSIYQTGWIDFERQASYVVIVNASDNGSPTQWSVQTVVVNVTDENDNPPVFGQTTYTFTIPEDEVGTSLWLALSHVADADTINAPTFTVIGGNFGSAGSFAIDSVNGNLSAVSADFEAQGSAPLSFSVTASAGANPRVDVGAGTAAVPDSVTINVILTDVNDVAPTFFIGACSNTTSLYRVDVSEYTAQGMPLMVAHSCDGDTTLAFRQRTYAIVSSADTNASLFSIDAETGVVSGPLLDREAADFYFFDISVTNTASGPNGAVLSSVARVEITVDDENDHNPEFQPSNHYNATVLENSPTGTLVMRVVATDLDAGDYGTVQYVLQGSAGPFAIGATTGDITVAAATIDYEATRVYVLSVIATDAMAHPAGTMRRVVPCCFVDQRACLTALEPQHILHSFPYFLHVLSRRSLGVPFILFLALSSLAYQRTLHHSLVSLSLSRRSHGMAHTSPPCRSSSIVDSDSHGRCRRRQRPCARALVQHNTGSDQRGCCQRYGRGTRALHGRRHDGCKPRHCFLHDCEWQRRRIV